MIYLIRILFFWLSMNGYFMLLKRKTKLPKEFIIPVSFTLLIILLFIAGILNLLSIVTVLILLGGIFCYAYLSHHHLLTKSFLKEYFDYKYFLLIAIFLVLTIVCLNLHLTEYDDFSHWALAVKNLFINNTLGNFEHNVDTFTSYPPGSALFIYYFGFVAGRTETSMLIGQMILNVGLISSLMVFFNDKKKITSSLVFILLVVLFLVINVPFNTLLVDSLLGFASLTGFAFAYYYRKNLKTGFILLTLNSVLLLLIKNSGLYFIFLNALLLIGIGKYNNNLKKGVKYTIYMCLIVLGVFLIWNQHLSLVYPNDIGTTSKHSLSIVNFGRNILRKGVSKSLEVLTKFGGAFIDLGSPITRYFIGINLLMIIFTFIFKKKRGELRKTTFFINTIYILYYLSLGAMYIVSMPYNEAIRLACYDRYMLTIIIVIIGIIALVYFELIRKEHNWNKYLTATVLIILSVMIYHYHDNVLFKGQSNYNETHIKRVKDIKEKISLKQYSNYEKLFYIDPKGYLCTFYNFALKYEYLDSKIKTTCEDIDVKTLNNNTLIVVPDEGKLPFEKEDMHYLKYINDNLYQKINEKN